MLERFTAEARHVVRTAVDEARRLHHPTVGTEHLLLAAIADEANLAGEILRGHGLTIEGVRGEVVRLVGAGGILDAEALGTLGIDLDQVRRATEAAFGPGALDRPGDAPVKGHIRFNGRAKKVMELAVRETLRMKLGSIGSGQLLLGLIREGEGLACRVLTGAGLDLAELRAETERRITAAAA